MSEYTEQPFDLSFIGAGLSCTYTLIHFIEKLNQLKPKHRVRICILDKANEFWTGIPYGNRSGVNSLIITSLKEFLPETERKIFIEWLKNNFQKIYYQYLNAEGTLPGTWLKNNEGLIEKKLWGKLYIPRHIFGMFLTERVNALIKAAVKNNLLEYTLLNAEVTNVQKENSLFKIIALTPLSDELNITSKKVVLSIGSPPKQEIEIGLGSTNQLCIQNMYEPNLKDNINKLYNFLQSTGSSLKQNILILGSNASSLEVIYNLQNNPEIEGRINKIYILSPDGMFPHRINEEMTASSFQPLNLASLRSLRENTCENILAALKKDVDKANEEKIAIADIHEPVSRIIIELLNNLNLYEQEQFVYKYGVEIGKLQRRAGAEYLDVVNRLISENSLEFIKGKFIKQVYINNSIYAEYIDTFSNKRKLFIEPVNALINCIGAVDLQKSYSLLIQNLIKNGICVVNGSNKGFVVNENFESSKDFFVIGPLLSGILNRKLRIWHAESCPRIFYLSQQLADLL